MKKSFLSCVTVKKTALNTDIIIRKLYENKSCKIKKKNTQQAVPTLVRVYLIGIGTKQPQTCLTDIYKPFQV